DRQTTLSRVGLRHHGLRSGKRRPFPTEQKSRSPRSLLLSPVKGRTIYRMAVLHLRRVLISQKASNTTTLCNMSTNLHQPPPTANLKRGLWSKSGRSCQPFSPSVVTESGLPKPARW